MFAVAAFDEQGDLIGEGIGEACSPVETLNPLPLPLCWAHLSRTALGLGCSSLAAQVKKRVCRVVRVGTKSVIAAERAAFTIYLLTAERIGNFVHPPRTIVRQFLI